MSPTETNRRYKFSTFGYGLGYIGAVFGISFLPETLFEGSIAGIFLAIIPALFISLMVLTFWRYINNIDEVARHDHISAMVISLMLVLIVSGGWGLVELFNENMPRIPIFYIYPIFFLTYGLIAAIRYKRC